MTASHAGTINTSMDVPQSQNTAPVLEFRCLYTPDIRRKQKRWQDGRLKFHTFNKRIMVYDERSNFVGDTHWKGGLDFEEGEELELERGGILVEVGECIGKRNQDLSELFDKRVKGREERVSAKIAASPGPMRTQYTPAGSAQLRPKPLNAMLTPTGHYGRAIVSSTSPFEERQSAGEKRDENEPPTKRRRQGDATCSKNGYAQNLMGATLSLGSSRPSSTPMIRYEPIKTRPMALYSPANAIDFTMDDEEERRAADARRKIAKEERKSMLERPSAKIKKHKSTSPANSGYASNLTGTPLVISRPDGRKATKTVPVKPLTHARHQEKTDPLLESGESSIGIEQSSNRQIQEVKKAKAVSQAEMGDENYSNDRGDNFISMNTLSKRQSPQSIKNAKDQRAHAIDLDGKTSFPPQEGSFIDIESTPTLLRKNLAKPKNSTPKVSRPSIMGQVTRLQSSSPLRVSLTTPALQQSGSFRKSTIQDSSIADLSPECQRPASGLRIRSRGPRKMMMLMDRSSVRSSGTRGSVGREKAPPGPLEALHITSDEVVLSQLTTAVDGFCEKQEAILQARLNSTRPKHHLVDISSSDPDNGIDHHKIDLLLSRKSVPSQKQVELFRSVPVSSPPIHTNPPARRIEQTTPAEKSNYVATKGTSSAGMNVLGDSHPLSGLVIVETRTDRNNEPWRHPPPARSYQNAVRKDFSSSVKQTVEDTHPLKRHVDVLKSVARVSERKEDAAALSKGYIREGASIQDESINFESGGRRPDPSKITKFASHQTTSSQKLFEAPESKLPKTAELPQNTDGERSYNQNNLKSGKKTLQPGYEHEEIPRPGNQANHALRPGAEINILKPAGLPEHNISVVQSASAHFRVMMQPSASSINLVAGAMSDSADSASSRQSNYSRIGPPSNEAAVELSLKPPPRVEEALEATSEPCSIPDFSSANTFAIESTALGTLDLKNDNSWMGFPKARLANPATRGKSLQTLAASTVEMANPSFKSPMPPPAPRRPIRTEQCEVLVGGEDQASGADSERKVALDGPWSREAFDLFGLRGPPQRNTGSKVAAA
ncbi:unnamed protein product [Diplocarpon coronariae]